MSYTATVTVNNVVLPDGHLHQAGDVVTLTDADYAQMGPALRAAVLSGVTLIPVGSSILTGTGAPSGVGGSGDFYLDTAASALYGPKAGSWPALPLPFGRGPWQFSPESYGAVGDNVTNDAAAINACFAAADAYANVHGLYEIVFKASVYYVGGTPITGGATQGSALMPIPPHLISTTVPTASKKITAIFTGAGYVSSGLYHWEQTTAQRAGTVLRTDYDGGGPGVPATGEVSVLGGPTPHFIGQPPNSWANVKVVVRGISIEVPATQNICGVDLRGCAEAEVQDLTVLVAQTGTGAPPIPIPGWSFGLAMPLTNNNDMVDIDNFSCEGFTYGLIAYEHLRANSLRLINNYLGLIIWNTGFPHSSVITYASIENCFKPLEMAGAVGKLDILQCDIEQGSGAIFTDACSLPCTGTINIGSNGIDGGLSGGLSAALSGGPTAVTGNTGIRIINRDQASGAIAAPTVPATTVALLNPFWRDAVVVISGGTVTAITVDGQAQGITSGTVMVGTGRTVAITYSAAPAWKWTLL